ncbi:hypothetical protein [Microbispora rosea]|nr:hypothetical protein [Microbispora rosea]
MNAVRNSGSPKARPRADRITRHTVLGSNGEWEPASCVDESLPEEL